MPFGLAMVTATRALRRLGRPSGVTGYPIKNGATTTVEAATSINSSETDVIFTMRLLDTICSF